MKKTYLTPQTEVAFAEVTSMLAESLPISDETVDGGEALFRQIMDGREKALAL